MLLVPTLAFAPSSWDAVTSLLPASLSCFVPALPGHSESLSIGRADQTVADMVSMFAQWAEDVRSRHTWSAPA